MEIVLIDVLIVVRQYVIIAKCNAKDVGNFNARVVSQIVLGAFKDIVKNVQIYALNVKAIYALLVICLAQNVQMLCVENVVISA